MKDMKRSRTLSAAALATAIAVSAAPVANAATAAPPTAPSTSVAPAAGSGTNTQAAGKLDSKLNGTWTDWSGKTGTVSGTFKPLHFVNFFGKPVAIGLADLTYTDAQGKSQNVKRLVSTEVKLPAAQPSTPSAKAASIEGGGQITQAASSSCQILNLDLAPLSLNLLGLNIHLNEVKLDITALPGGGLLGDLLCGVDNLLNGGLGNIVGQVTNLLNQILGVLNNSVSTSA
jgi:hypothetical protein